MSLGHRNHFRLFTLLAVIGGGIVVGVGIGSAVAGWTMESDVQSQIKSILANCAHGSPCPAPAPASDWPEYQLGQHFVSMGLLEMGLGVLFIVGGAMTWVFGRRNLRAASP